MDGTGTLAVLYLSSHSLSNLSSSPLPLSVSYMYMRKGLGIFLENCEKLAATRD